MWLKQIRKKKSRNLVTGASGFFDQVILRRRGTCYVFVTGWGLLLISDEQGFEFADGFGSGSSFGCRPGFGV